jgi:hypothetical protein
MYPKCCEELFRSALGMRHLIVGHPQVETGRALLRADKLHRTQNMAHIKPASSDKDPPVRV